MCVCVPVCVCVFVCVCVCVYERECPYVSVYRCFPIDSHLISVLLLSLHS